MYSFDTPLKNIKGIGPKLSNLLSEQGFYTLIDLLMFLPLRYSDRSEIVSINDLELDKLVTFEAELKSVSGFYKNRRRMDTAVVEDKTGKVKLMWFNNKFISKSLKKGQIYMVSGKLNDRGTITQPTMEVASLDNIHTGRLVPIYSSTLDFQQGKLRRLLRHITTEIKSKKMESSFEDSLKNSIIELHFPEGEDQIILARERLALEELWSLIKVSEKIKAHWKNLKSAKKIKISKSYVPKTIPFELTNAQKRSIAEILKDLGSSEPMNRVLIGDVGSGKTVVAGIAAQQVLENGFSVAFVAPTKILADQHLETLRKLFPTIEIELLTGKTKEVDTSGTKLFLGTHAVINKIDQINPGLIIYDEQHRFGVKQRSSAGEKSSEKSSEKSGEKAGEKAREDKDKTAITPHTLTMSATPIPRSLMLTIFSHLKVSFIDEMPSGRKETKTWIVPEGKKKSGYDWIANEVSKTNGLAILVCPFIDPSNHQAFENVASTKEIFENIKKHFADTSISNSRTNSSSRPNSSSKPNPRPKPKIGLLHGRIKTDEQQKIIKRLYKNKIDILVTTPIVEVGVDLPAASIIVIESADRFGMASLHQLRGRVGRAGQQGYCLLFSNSKSPLAKKRLLQFSKENNGLKLAELDLKNRGSGDIFGTTQSGFSQLKFANWANLELIAQAKQTYPKLPKKWLPFFGKNEDIQAIKPLAN